MTMQHILYCTICIPTSHYYIGAHSTDHADDSYLGSGQLIRKSVRKYGSTNHVRKTLETFESREDLMIAEAAAISQCVDDAKCLNLQGADRKGKSDASGLSDGVSDILVRNMDIEVYGELRDYALKNSISVGKAMAEAIRALAEGDIS